MTTTFRLEEDEEPMATEPIYLSSDEREYSTPNTTPDQQLDCIYPASINQLIASQLEQRSNMGAETIVHPPTPDTPQSPTPENRGQSDDFNPDIIPLHNPPIS